MIGQVLRSAGSRRLIFHAVIAIALLATALPAARRIGKGKTGDFGHLWMAAEAMLKGQDIYASGGGYYIYPPLTAFIFQPLGALPERPAAMDWLVLNVALTFSALIIASKEVASRWSPRNNAGGDSAWPVIAAGAAVLTADKIRSIFNLGQIDCFMLLGFALVLCWMERKPLLAGMAVGFAANIKYLTLICVPYFIIKRNYRAATASLLSFVFFMLLPAIEVGFRRSLEYAGMALGGLIKMISAAAPGAAIPDVAWERSVSITSAVFRFTRSHELSDGFAAGLVLSVLAAVLAAIFNVCWRQDVFIFRKNHEQPGFAINALPSLEWAILICLALTFSPHTTTRQMVLLSLIFTVAMAVVLANVKTRIPLIGAMALMLAGLTLPPFGVGLNQAYWTWRAIGGPSWCAIVLILTLAWAGSRAITGLAQKTEDQVDSNPPATI